MALAAQTDWYSFTGAGSPGNNLTMNNSGGFSALPGGYRSNYGSFYYQSDYGYWWSATENGASYAWYRSLFYGNDFFYRYYYLKSCGFSVRLVRDN
jgi:uncharacterized protein (TIGR02145 family)